MSKYSGIWPVAPTPFHPNGEVDYEGMKRVLDCMIDQGVDGICILANFSEQFLITDGEREALSRLSLEHVAGRVPVIVTISHYATNIVLQRARLSKELGAEEYNIARPMASNDRIIRHLIFDHNISDFDLAVIQMSFPSRT